MPFSHVHASTKSLQKSIDPHLMTTIARILVVMNRDFQVRRSKLKNSNDDDVGMEDNQVSSSFPLLCTRRVNHMEGKSILGTAHVFGVRFFVGRQCALSFVTNRFGERVPVVSAL